MVQYYSEYKDDTILQSLTGEIGFTHNVITFTKSKDRRVVEYLLKKTSNSIGIASYSAGPELPEYYHEILLSIENIEKGLT